MTMQLGRRWRAARPRDNIVDAAYSQRLPYRCVIDAQVKYAGNFYTLASNHSSACTFDPVSLTWKMIAAIPPGLNPPMTGTFTYRIDTAAPQAFVKILLDDGAVSTCLMEWTMTYPQPGLDPLVGYPPRHFDNAAFTGSFTDAFYGLIRPVIYADEP